MFQGRRHIVSLAFLLCFLVYVLSPVCYAAESWDGPGEHGSITASKSPHKKTLHPVWQLLFAGGKQDDAGDGPSTVRFLLKKARAVLVTSKSQPEHEDLVVSPVTGVTPFESPLPFVFSSPSPYPTKGALRSFSGLSPPCV
ncbi:MAG: hypothetical protein WC291_10730 [Thermodesulfovibrionales bacterium]|jgi:hypothetical protein